MGRETPPPLVLAMHCAGRLAVDWLGDGVTHRRLMSHGVGAVAGKVACVADAVFGFAR